MAQVTDQELMQAIKVGDTEAFAALVAAHKPWLRRLLYHLLWNWEDADDGVQEVFVRVWLARERYEPRAKLKTWLFTLARHWWLNHSTRVVRKHPVVSLQDQFGPGAQALIEKLADQSPTPEQQLIQSYEVFRIRRAVDQLPEKQRLVFILSQYEDLRYAQIAELLDIPEGTVKSRMATAVSNLRKALAAEGAWGR